MIVAQAAAVQFSNDARSPVKRHVEDFVVRVFLPAMDLQDIRVGGGQAGQQQPLLLDAPGMHARHHPTSAIIDTRSTSLGRTPWAGSGCAKSSDCPFQTTCGSPS